MQIIQKLLLGSILILLVSSCYKEEIINKREGLDDWTNATHGQVSPNYNQVFDDTRVAKITLKMTPENWQLMQDDMTNLSGPFGAGGGGFGGPEPVYVESSLFYDGIEWYHVGVRYKGAGSLQSGWGMGNFKLPFRIHFDRFEDTYPLIKNQRFYGFRQFALSSGFKDMALIREKVVTDMFNDFGVPAAKGTFVRLYLDHGDGEKFLGVYTLSEIVQESVLTKNFTNTSGNLYKPNTTFEAGTFDPLSFPNKTNEIGGNWSDIQELYDVLHSPLRTTNHLQWKTNLEAVFDVDLFLKFLAVTVAIENPDVYGNDGHNFYLYHNPTDGLFNWIPWDHNEALLAIGGPQGGELPLAINTLGTNWPLINYIVEDSIYLNTYKTHLGNFSTAIFDPPTIKAKYQALHDLISPYVIGPISQETPDATYLMNGASDFNNGLNYLKSHADTRKVQIDTYLQ